MRRRVNGVLQQQLLLVVAYDGACGCLSEKVRVVSPWTGALASSPLIDCVAHVAQAARTSL